MTMPKVRAALSKSVSLRVKAVKIIKRARTMSNRMIMFLTRA